MNNMGAPLCQGVTIFDILRADDVIGDSMTMKLCTPPARLRLCLARRVVLMVGWLFKHKSNAIVKHKSFVTFTLT